jgi:hypothetical protein
MLTAKWFRLPMEFVKDAGMRGIAFMGASVVSFVVGTLERIHGRSVPPFLFDSLSVVLFWCGAYAAWLKKHERLEELESAREAPRLYLRYDPQFRSSTEHSGLFLQAEGELKAFNVKISSETAVGNHHTRLGMKWMVPQCPIGKDDTVPVDVVCGHYIDGVFQPFNGFAGEQLNIFFDRKAENPQDLFVTLEFRDVEGRACPPRKFTISRFQDARGHRRIGCAPEIQAAS